MSQGQPSPQKPVKPIGHIISMLCLAATITIINGFELLAGQPRLNNEMYVIAGQDVAYGAFMCWYHSKVTANMQGLNIAT